MEKRNIKFSPPDITEEEINEVAETLRSGWITTGPRTKLLERRLAAYIESGRNDIDVSSNMERWMNRVVCLSSATAAEELNARATTDIDLKAEKISNDLENMKEVFNEIISLETDDPIRFDLDSLNVKSITEFKKYHGVNVSILGYLDRTEINVSIDIGFGDL